MAGRSGRLLAAALLVALAAAAPVALAKTCVVNTTWTGPVEYECGTEEERDADEPWWAKDTTQAIVAFAGIVVSGAAAGYTYYRMRERRKTLSDYVRAVESTYAAHKSNPAEGRPKLVALRAEIRTRHEKGRIEDAQFLELDKRLASYVARLRVLDATARFPGLPAAFLADLRTRVEDGRVSEADVDALAAHPSLWRMQATTRDEVVAMLRDWAAEDEAPLDPGTTATVVVRR